jgi:hypothetical protein
MRQAFVEITDKWIVRIVIMAHGDASFFYSWLIKSGSPSFSVVDKIVIL